MKTWVVSQPLCPNEMRSVETRLSELVRFVMWTVFKARPHQQHVETKSTATLTTCCRCGRAIGLTVARHDLSVPSLGCVVGYTPCSAQRDLALSLLIMLYRGRRRRIIAIARLRARVGHAVTTDGDSGRIHSVTLPTTHFTGRMVRLPASHTVRAIRIRYKYQRCVCKF